LRALGRKASDEWVVPLCNLHHRALHDAGDEEAWWKAQGVDARAEAEGLWREHCSATIAGALPLSSEGDAGPSGRDIGPVTEAPETVSANGAERSP